MTKIQVKQTIDASAEKVWKTIRSFENPERFVPIVKSSSINRSGDSVQRMCTVQFGDQEGKLVEQLNLVDDEHKVLEFTIAEAPPPFKGMHERWQITALSDDTSEIQISTELENANPEVVQTVEGIFKMVADGLRNLHEKEVKCSMALYGIYGRHEINTCPWNNKENAKRVIETANSDLSQILPNYKINKIVGQYHSGLEHTFLWILDAEDPHLIQQFAVETGMASFNEVKIVPLETFAGVVEGAKKIHGL